MKDADVPGVRAGHDLYSALDQLTQRARVGFPPASLPLEHPFGEGLVGVKLPVGIQHFGGNQRGKQRSV